MKAVGIIISCAAMSAKGGPWGSAGTGFRSSAKSRSWTAWGLLPRSTWMPACIGSRCQSDVFSAVMMALAAS